MLIWLMIIAGIVFLDQLSKWLTVINLELGETFPLIEGVFHFTYVQNTGAAFSMFNKPDERWIFMSISTVAIIALSIHARAYQEQVTCSTICQKISRWKTELMSMPVHL